MSASPRHKDTRRRRWMPTGRPAASTITTSTTNIISTRRSRRRRWMPTGRPLASTTTTSTTNTISTRRRRRRRWGTRGRTRTLLRHSRTDTRRRRCTRRRTRSRRRPRRTGTSAPRSARDASRPFVAAASWTYASDDEERRSNYRMQSPAKMACSEGIYTTTYVDGPFYVIAG
ncbi:Os03g0200400 [Oryza sativa Japonica Group]|uniref:Expressed protein n=2 Tax=Oryza sativa subsp. japonica TaxID=39947 RepID=Q10QD9_ORYSJ|nr:serine/arginine repetitive matrix protein 2 [Oryza sativa Japonica Group]ABF94490.1 expressed protein [Oryza sativa Japonica Group]EEE58519.1 hypothetical protein OsJ_09803 [Oryza sativa Japonica Group]BAG97942.1 unnamed protein product [Oryza sativa Japonica Group]BAS82812.1 Os03g0200400 [Oryza sativa Japonica Group]